ncbi:hypothetical protein B296_00035713, partial [Ensete ventricosum]
MAYEGNEEEGQPGMARQAVAKAPLQGGGRLRPGPLQGAAGCGQDPCKGRP